jgi:hypothetical protein
MLFARQVLPGWGNHLAPGAAMGYRSSASKVLNYSNEQP